MRTIYIGRNVSNDIVLDSLVVSDRHAELVIDGNNRMMLVDYSRNGTSVNGRLLCNNRCEVFVNDRIVFPDGHELDWSQICQPSPKTIVNRPMTMPAPLTDGPVNVANPANHGMAQNVNIVIGTPNQNGNSGQYTGNGIPNAPVEYTSMSMGDAINSVFSKFATFNGRARRSEYWYWQLFYILIAIIPFLGWFVWPIVAFIPTLALTVRRLHDTGKSGLLLLLLLIPFANFIISIIFFVWYCTDSEPGTNQYGPNPKTR